MAGLGEACSHTAALLFCAETNSQMKKDIWCTSAPCSWLPTGCKKVEYAPISAIDFRIHRKKSRVESSSSSTTNSASSDIPSPTDDELTSFYSDLSQSSTKSAILSLIYHSIVRTTFQELKKGVLPMPLTDLYDKKCFELISFFWTSKWMWQSVCNSYYTEQGTLWDGWTSYKKPVLNSWYLYRAGHIKFQKCST